MNLKNILAGIEGIKAKGDIDIEINSVKNDSRKVENGDLFISIKGYETDGADYVGEAVEKGAKVVLVEEGTNLKELNLGGNNVTDISVLKNLTKLKSRRNI